MKERILAKTEAERCWVKKEQRYSNLVLYHREEDCLRRKEYLLWELGDKVTGQDSARQWMLSKARYQEFGLDSTGYKELLRFVSKIHS